MGYWSGQEDIVANWAVSRTFVPQIGAERRAGLLRGWEKAVGRTLDWAERE